MRNGGNATIPGNREPLDAPGIQFRPKPSLRAGTRHHLHAHADAENRDSIFKDKALEDIAHSGRVQPFHCPVECTDTGKYQSSGLCQRGCGTCGAHGHAQPAVDIYDCLDVPQAVVDDGNQRLPPTSIPSAFMIRAPDS